MSSFSPESKRGSVTELPAREQDLPYLIRLIQHGDAEAFGELYDRFHDRVYAYALRETGSRTDADDITAGVFLYVLEHIDRFTWRGGGFSAWLFSIARNDVRDYFRRRGGNAREACSGEIVERAADEQVEDQAESSWNERQLRQAIFSLSEDQQQVMLLKLLLNCTNRQIGELLGKTESAVKALRRRSLLALRKSLA